MKRMTKTAKRARAAVSRKKTGILKAVRSLLKKTNPSAKITGARVARLKGGGLTIRPIKANAAGRVPPRGTKDFKTGAAAQSFVRKLEKAGIRPSVSFEDYRPAGRLTGAKRRRYTVRW